MNRSAAELIQHIVDRFHRPLRSELSAIDDLLESETPDETIDSLRSTFSALAEDLRSHLEKEERVLFPHIVEMEEAVGAQPPRATSGGITPGIVSVMMREHETAQLDLVSLRRITRDYAPAAEGPPGRSGLYARLAAFEDELRRHIALEDGVLFPQALELERALRGARWSDGSGRPA